MFYFLSYFFPHLVFFSGLKVTLPRVTISSQGGLSLSMQMGTFQRLWQQPKATLCRADIDFSSESPSLLLSHDCVCSSGHKRCLGPSSPAVLVPAVCIEPGTNPAGEIFSVAGLTSSGSTRLLHHLAKADLCALNTRGRCPHLNSWC